ncbi:1-deoxy-D-xylulose-5-phosphate synthase N-terminal domain-containing protein, partial [Francisella tularensis]
MSKYTILDKINTPSDLKLIPESQLKILSEELRAFLVDTIDVSGGH